MSTKQDFINAYQERMTDIARQRAVINRERDRFEQRTAEARAIVELAREDIEKRVLDFLDAEGMDALTDATSARFVYQAGWSDGMGISGLQESLGRIINRLETYISIPFSGWMCSDDNKNVILRMSVRLEDENVDETRLARTAEVLEPIFRAQLEIWDEAYVEVFIDGHDGEYDRSHRIEKSASGEEGQYDYYVYRGIVDRTGSLQEMLEYAKRHAQR